MICVSSDNFLSITICLIMLITSVYCSNKCPSHCQACTDSNSCLVCKPPFDLNDKGLCQINNYIEACQVYSSDIFYSKNQCVKCSPGFTLVKGRCHQIIKNCEEINEYSECQKCA